MHRFWEGLIKPLLLIVRPVDIVEIGSEFGLNTKNILQLDTDYQPRLHVIDPMPQFDVEGLQRQFEGRVEFYRGLSLDNLKEIGSFDAVLIDGDHNWYTVFHELKLIESICIGNQQDFPVVILHDIGWPYGRRDMYYDPETIPETHRRPYKKLGISLDSANLLEAGGINSNLNNAVDQNTPHNGVLTAVEDFLTEIISDVEFVKLPAFHGFGLIIPKALVEELDDLREFLDALTLAPPVRRILEESEKRRIIEIVELQDETVKIQKEMEKEVENRDAEIHKIIKVMEERGEEIDDFSIKLQEQQIELSHTFDELNRLRNSRSWKVFQRLRVPIVGVLSAGSAVRNNLRTILIVLSRLLRLNRRQ